MPGEVCLYNEVQFNLITDVREVGVEPTEMYKISLPKGTLPEGFPPQFLADHPDIAGQLNALYLPPLLVPSDQLSNMSPEEAIIDGWRTVTLRHGPTVRLKARDLGIDEQGQDWEQPFTIRIKGAGFPWHQTPTSPATVRSSRLGLTDASDIAKAQALLSSFGLVPLPVLIGGRSFNDNRPIGGSLSFGRAGRVTDFLIEHRIGVKFTPFLGEYRFPFFAKRAIMKTMHKLQELGVRRTFGIQEWRTNESLRKSLPDHNKGKHWTMVQEHNLAPGNIRAEGFCRELDIEDFKLRFQALGVTPETYLKDVAPLYRRDARALFDALAKSLRFSESNPSVLVYTQVGDLATKLNESDAEFNRKTGLWYLVKDLILTQTGLYMTDLDCALPEAFLGKSENGKIEGFEKKAFRYFTIILREYLRLLTHLRITIEVLLGKKIETLDFKSLEEEEYQALVASLQTSKYYGIKNSPLVLSVTWNQNPPPGTFTNSYTPNPDTRIFIDKWHILAYGNEDE